MNEADFLTNISRRLGRPSPLKEPPERTVIGAPDFWKNYQLDESARLAQFQNSLENLGGHVVVCQTVSELRDALAHLLDDLKPGKIGTWGDDTLKDFDVASVVSPYHPILWGKDTREQFEEVEIGITGCAYAIADTGTLVMKSNAHRGRSVSVMPAVHIALVRECQIYTRLGEVLKELESERDHMASSVHFISGPSRSSDIENDSTIGIHGPAAVHAFVLRSSRVDSRSTGSV